jgi:hypothetical protein
MTTHEGVFALTGWQEDPYEESPTTLTYATIGQAWKGDGVEAEVQVRNLMHYAPDGTASFVGLLRFTGTIGGRAGSFVAQGIGVYDGSTVTCDLTVAPGSGTGDFEGLSGTGTSAAPKGPEGTWTLDLS